MEKDGKLSAADAEKQAVQLGATEQLERGLKSRHLVFISMGGTVGTGLFLGSGDALAKAGPVGCLIAYLFVGSILFSVMTSLGEMATYIPVAGSFTSYNTRFVDPSLGFAMGWLYWLSWAITYALELTAAGLIIQYWNASLSVGIFIAVFWVFFTALNFLPVRWFGELEMWFSSIKVITILGFLIFGICVDAGVGRQGYLGFRNWTTPGPFTEYMVSGSSGKFVGFWAVLIQASFSYQGAELVGVCAGEARNPRKTVPRAIRNTFWGILFLFVFTIFFIGLLVPSTDDRLQTGASDASASPLVIAADLAGISVLPDLINGVLLTAVLSAANSNVYSGSRILIALADEGQAPAFITRTNKHGIPYFAVAITSAFGLLAFLNLSANGGNVFNWFLNIIGVAGLITWASINISHLRFMRALSIQNIPRSTLPYVAPLQPFLAYYGLFMNILVTLTQGFTVFIDWNTSDFFAAYVSVLVFLVLLIGHKMVSRSRPVKSSAIDLNRGRLEDFSS